MTTISKFLEKMIEIVKTPLGWLAGLFLFLADAVAGGRLVVYIVVVATVIDLACGIAVSLKKGKFALSELMRLTVEKVVVYGLALLVFLSIDKAIEDKTDFDWALTSALVGVVITLTETWSFLASLLILFPNNPFLKLLQKSLTGEIARKLGCDEAEVAKTLNLKRRAKKQPRTKNGQFTKK